MTSAGGDDGGDAIAILLATRGAIANAAVAVAAAAAAVASVAVASSCAIKTPAALSLSRFCANMRGGGESESLRGVKFRMTAKAVEIASTIVAAIFSLSSTSEAARDAGRVLPAADGGECAKR